MARGRDGGTHEASLNERARVLLIEHVDAIGAAAIDAGPRATALRTAGAEVELAVLEGGHEPDLLHETCERAPRVIHTRHVGERALESLARTVRASRAEHVVWASAVPGGGPAAARVLDGRPARWWPTGFTPLDAERGPLAPSVAGVSPAASHVLDSARPSRSRLSLWDGPFVLAFASPSKPGTARIVEAFASVASYRDELELVLLGRPDPSLERLAREHEVQARVHCVGRAPREAEACWLQTAVCSIVGEDTPVSGGLLLRTLASGHACMAACETGALHDWLARERLVWGAPGDPLGERLEAALDAHPDVLAATIRARAFAGRHDGAALDVSAQQVLTAFTRRERRAA